MVDIISAYTELERWQKLESVIGDKNFYPGDVLGNSADGLEVDFGGGRIAPPETAQYILEWVPVVYAVWNEESNGEDGNGEDGHEDGTGGEANPEEPDSEPGQPGPSNAGE